MNDKIKLNSVYGVYGINCVDVSKIYGTKNSDFKAEDFKLEPTHIDIASWYPSLVLKGDK